MLHPMCVGPEVCTSLARDALSHITNDVDSLLPSTAFYDDVHSIGPLRKESLIVDSKLCYAQLPALVDMMENKNLCDGSVQHLLGNSIMRVILPGKGTLHSAEGIMERANNALSLFTFREGEIHLLRKNTPAGLAQWVHAELSRRLVHVAGQGSCCALDNLGFALDARCVSVEGQPSGLPEPPHGPVGLAAMPDVHSQQADQPIEADASVTSEAEEASGCCKENTGQACATRRERHKGNRAAPERIEQRSSRRRVQSRIDCPHILTYECASTVACSPNMAEAAVTMRHIGRRMPKPSRFRGSDYVL